MATRIPVSWLILLVIVGIFAFFGYHIIQASQPKEVNVETYDQLLNNVKESHKQQVNHEEHAPIVSQAPPIPHSMPHVPGQTEEDLRSPEPLQRTPPAVQYDSPEAIDPMNKTVYMDATFGNNFRHPEQMIEERPASNMNSVVRSGLGSEQSSPGGHNANMYSPEMAQNGGEFMRGINAFDISESGSAYSMI